MATINISEIIAKLQNAQALTEEEEIAITMAANQANLPTLYPMLKEFFIFTRNGSRGKVYGTSIWAICKVIDGIKNISEIEDILFEENNITEEETNLDSSIIDSSIVIECSDIDSSAN